MEKLKLVRFRSEEVEELSALYVNGKLDTVGDSYRIDNRIAELAGVEEQEGNFLLGGKNYGDAAQTIEDIEAYEQRKQEAQAQAQALLDQAEELRRQAQAILNE